MGKLNYKKTFLLGFGFFAINITWAVYNAFMPKLLGGFIASSAIIGFIMTIDNYLGLFIQPAVGMYSDTIKSRFGRRIPFLMVGMPLAALFTFLIPNYKGLATLVAFLVLMNLSMSIFRSPVIALMPDITEESQRSKANSIINFMGGVGSLVAFFIGSMLWDISPKYPFYLAGILVILSFIIIFTLIKEKRDVINYEEAEEKVNIKEGIRIAMKNTSTKFLLFAVGAWYVGYNGVETFFTIYAEKYLNIDISTAAFSFSFISLSFLISAIPAGIIGTKIGKKKTISIGILGSALCFIVLFFIKSILLIRIIFILVGMTCALIGINAYPLVAQKAPSGYLGTFTGLYYIFVSAANIISPPLLGGIFDFFGYSWMFIYGAIFMGISWLLMIKVNE